MIKKIFLPISGFFLTTIVILVFSFNQNLLCMDRGAKEDDDMKRMVSSKASNETRREELQKEIQNLEARDGKLGDAISLLTEGEDVSFNQWKVGLRMISEGNGINYWSNCLLDQCSNWSCTSIEFNERLIGEKGMKSLVKALVKATLTDLTSLTLYSTKSGDEEIKALSKAKFPNLRSLDLPNSKITYKGIEALTVFTNLSSLDLSLNKIDVKFVQALSNDNFPNLEKLDLSSSCSDTKAMKTLLITNFTNLKELGLDDIDCDFKTSNKGQMRVKDELEDELKKKFGNILKEKYFSFSYLEDN